MDRVGAFAAKTHFSTLLERVAKGETIEITRRGKLVARLVPVPDIDRARAQAAVERLRELRKDVSLGGLSIKELKDEGRP